MTSTVVWQSVAQNHLLSTLYYYPETKEADVPDLLPHARVPTIAFHA